MLITFLKANINYYFKPMFPLEAVIYLTNKCNMHCNICDIGLSQSSALRQKPEEISSYNIDKIIVSMKKLRVPSIYITGGEPFLADNFWYLLRACADNGIRISGITTNGSTLHMLSAQQIDILNAAKVNKLIISLDHATAEGHDAHRGSSGLFNGIMDFLQSSKADAINTMYCFSTVITKANYRELSSIVDMCSTVKRVRHINFQPVCIDSIFLGYDANKQEKAKFRIDRPLFDDLDNQIEAAIAVAKKLRVTTTLPFLRIWIRSYFDNLMEEEFFFKELMNGYICSKPYNYIHINYNGDLLACTHIGTRLNIASGDIDRLWKGIALSYKNALNQGNYFPKCRNCFCDFGSNYRYSLLYKPFKNRVHIMRLFYYYLIRYFKKT